MIEVGMSEGAGFARRLAAKAGKLASARVEARLRGRSGWRSAALLWPLFAKDDA